MIAKLILSNTPRIPPSTRLRRALQRGSLPLASRIILFNPQSANLIRNPDPTDRYNTTLHLAAQLGLVDIADFLLAHGHEEPGFSRNLDGLTPLMLAAQAGNDEANETIRARIEVGRLILSRYPDCAEIRDNEGMDAFAHASRHGTLPLLHILLSLPTSASQDPDPQPHGPRPPRTPTTSYPQLLSRDSAGNTPLHQASAAGQLKTLRLFVSLGADHTARNNANWTPVDYSASVAAEVYLRELVRERDGARMIGTAAAEAGGSRPGSASGSGSDSPMALRDANKGARNQVRLVQSEDEGSDTGGA